MTPRCSTTGCGAESTPSGGPGIRRPDPARLYRRLSQSGKKADSAVSLGPSAGAALRRSPSCLQMMTLECFTNLVAGCAVYHLESIKGGTVIFVSIVVVGMARDRAHSQKFRGIRDRDTNYVCKLLRIILYYMH